MNTQNSNFPALGFGMEGMGPAVERITELVCDQFKYVTYLEIGVGYGVTLAAVAEMIRRRTTEWRAIGVDLPDGYSLDMNQVSRSMHARNLPNDLGRRIDDPPEWNKVTVYLANSQAFLPIWEEPIHLALIDGCHGKPCATNDFLNIEKHVVEGGIVMFHDFGQDQVGQDQPHCKTGVDVRGACADLGLLDNTRPEWHFLDTLIGDKRGGSGDMGVFQKL